MTIKNFLITAPTRNDDEDQTEFGDIYVIHKFIRNVFSIISLQFLVITILLYLYQVSICTSVHNSFLTWLAVVIVLFVSSTLLALYFPGKHNFLRNLIILIMYTVSLSLLLGWMNCFWSFNLLIVFSEIIAVASVGVAVFAMQTKQKFTIQTGLFIVFAMSVLFTGVMLLMWLFNITHYFLYIILLPIPIALGFGTLILYVFSAGVLTYGYAPDLEPNEYFLAVLYIECGTYGYKYLRKKYTSYN